MSHPQLTTTASGLRVISEPLAGVRSVAFGIWVGVGSRFEEEREAGVSHFIEHLLFKGTPAYSAQQIAELFDGLGGEVNAATGRDYTVFYTRILDDHLDQAAPVLADMLQHPGFYDLDQEREVVLEEIAMYEDDPQDKVHDLVGAAIFPDQSLGRPVIGTQEVIGSVDNDRLRDYFGRHYTSRRMVLAAAGSITHDRLVELGETLLGDVPLSQEPPAFEPAVPGPPTLVVQEKPTEQYHLVLGGPGISRNDARRHAQSLLDTVLGGSMSSRLFQEIREKRGLAYAVGSYSVGYAETGQVGVFLGTREENLVTACDVIATELRRMADEPVPAEELARAKEHVKGRLVLSLESPAMRMNRIGKATVTDAELLSIDEIIERIDAVTAADIQEVAAEHWQPESLSLAAIGPDGSAVRRGVERLSPEFADIAVKNLS
jgi:predicted Zn-dependent peptidase